MTFRDLQGRPLHLIAPGLAVCARHFTPTGTCRTLDGQEVRITGRRDIPRISLAGFSLWTDVRVLTVETTAVPTPIRATPLAKGENVTVRLRRGNYTGPMLSGYILSNTNTDCYLLNASTHSGGLGVAGDSGSGVFDSAGNLVGHYVSSTTNTTPTLGATYFSALCKYLAKITG